jgi:hypothetical protein
MDRRPEEVRHIQIMVDFLCDEYPKLFAKGEYTHPVLGVCKTLTIQSNAKQTFDITNIDEVRFDFIENQILISTESPKLIHIVREFIKDATVM